MNTRIITTDGKEIFRKSRWIKRRTNYNPNKRNSLYYYTCDGYGYRQGTENYNPVEHGGKFLDYFRFNGRNYAIEQFISMSSPFASMVYQWEDKEGKLNFLSGYDSENYFNPILIEISDCGEYIRVYEEGRN